MPDFDSQTFPVELFPFGYGSDNHSGVHPRLMDAMARVNSGFAPSYGTDVVTQRAVQIFREHFGPETEVHFCFNGTAANILALAPLVKSHQSIFCSDVAHIHVDECGAPEKNLGVKLIPVASRHGKIAPEAIEPFVIRRGDQHFSQASAVSITQPTENGTVYSRQEMSALVAFCRKHDLWLHIDGARFVNATVATRLSLRDLAEGADSLSFGGTKNGFMFGEAVLFLSDKARRQTSSFPFIRKQLMQLPSKTRFIAAQFVEFLGSNLWQEIAIHACGQAQLLRQNLERHASLGIELTQKTESNAVFAIFPKELEKKFRKLAFFYIWNESTREARLMTSWSTTDADLNATKQLLESFGET